MTLYNICSFRLSLYSKNEQHQKHGPPPLYDSCSGLGDGEFLPHPLPSDHVPGMQLHLSDRYSRCLFPV